MNAVKSLITNPVRRTVAMGIGSGALMLVYGLFLSREHITHVGHMLRLAEHEAATLFIFVDLLAVFGKMMMSKHLSAKTRRIGKWFLIAGGALSLTCNVVSGFASGGYGAAGYGAFIVGIIAALEYATANIRAKRAATAKPADVAAPAPSATAAPVGRRKCAQGCTCGRHARKLHAVRPTVTPAVRAMAAASN